MWSQSGKALASETVARLLGEKSQVLRVDVRGLSGGLEAASVDWVRLFYEDPQGRKRKLDLVVKRLRGAARREAEVYEKIQRTPAASAGPALYAIERTETDALLYLEAIRARGRWPWKDVSRSAELLSRVAKVHVEAQRAGIRMLDRDYEADLEASAESTLAAIEGACRKSELSAAIRRTAPAARRFVSRLRAARAELRRFSPFGWGLIHGDVHSGNALVRPRPPHDPVLVDWGRARLGSPLEDVSSWLKSTATWEPEVLRRHDTLLHEYACRWSSFGRLTDDLRGAYWLAAASNALFGALRYHLWIATGAAGVPCRRRAASVRAAEDWMRVLRRAASYLD